MQMQHVCISASFSTFRLGGSSNRNGPLSGALLEPAAVDQLRTTHNGWGPDPLCSRMRHLQADSNEHQELRHASLASLAPSTGVPGSL